MDANALRVMSVQRVQMPAEILIDAKKTTTKKAAKMRCIGKRKADDDCNTRSALQMFNAPGRNLLRNHVWRGPRAEAMQ